MEAFQEIDQVAVFRPITKWADRIYDARRIPEIVATAFRQATTGRPGPVYLDLPGDILGEKVDEEKVAFPPALGDDYVWNNDCGDAPSLWDGRVWIDRAYYDPHPQEGRILQRSGDKLI
jgi:hypothetical protein